MGGESKTTACHMAHPSHMWTPPHARPWEGDFYPSWNNQKKPHLCPIWGTGMARVVVLGHSHAPTRRPTHRVAEAQDQDTVLASSCVTLECCYPSLGSMSSWAVPMMVTGAT